MARERLCKVCREWHPLDAWPSECLKLPATKRANFPVPMFTSDGMEPVKSMVDGLWYDSKSTLRKTYAQNNVTEIGNDVPMAPQAPREEPRAVREARTVDALKKTGVWDDLPA